MLDCSGGESWHFRLSEVSGFQVSGCLRFQGFRFQGFRVSEVSGFQGFRVSEVLGFQGFRVSGFRFQGFWVSEVPGFQGFRVSGFWGPAGGGVGAELLAQCFGVRVLYFLFCLLLGAEALDFICCMLVGGLTHFGVRPFVIIFIRAAYLMVMSVVIIFKKILYLLPFINCRG